MVARVIRFAIEEAEKLLDVEARHLAIVSRSSTVMTACGPEQRRRSA